MADGRGYTFEYRIPWSTLGAKAPLKGGDLVAGTVQFNWGAPDGLHTAGGSAWCYDVMAGPGFPYQNTACWGKIIFSDKGQLPKEHGGRRGAAGETAAAEIQLYAAGRQPDHHSAAWTRTIWSGASWCRRVTAMPARTSSCGMAWTTRASRCPPGDYTWKGIYHQPITQKFLFSPHNSGQPPYETDDGTGGWGGDHGSPQDVCAFPGGVISLERRGSRLGHDPHRPARQKALGHATVCHLPGHGWQTPLRRRRRGLQRQRTA